MKESERKRMGAFVKMMKGEKITVRKKRAKETKPREQPERELRNDVIKQLRRKGVIVMRIENGVGGRRNSGIGDLLVFNLNKNIAGFIELKDSKHGVLSKVQKIFRENCIRCGINHWVVRSVSEAMEVIL